MILQHWTTTAAVIGLALAAGVSMGENASPPATAASQPVEQDRDLVKNGDDSVRFAAWQDGRQIPQNDRGVIHLQRKAFELRFAGRVDRTTVIASHDATLADALDKAGRVVTVTGMGGAYDNGTLLVEDKAQVKPWEKFADVFDADERAKYAEILRKQFQQLPTVLEGVNQPLHSEKDDKTWTLKVDQLFNGDLAKDRQITLIVAVVRAVDGELFEEMKWRRVTLLFDD